MTRIQLATGYIDLPDGTDFPIDLSFAAITENGARSGGVSRSIEVDGTDNNTTLIGAYFEVDLSNDTFNRNVKTECSVVQNGVEVFEGYIQLLEIKRVNRLRGTNRKHVKYKINVFDNVSNFFNEMGEKELTDLSFPELSHTFNRANIISSWSNTSGYTYPQFAKDDNVYTLRDFKPAIYEYEYWKKIFASNGYTFTFDQFDDDDIRLNKRIIPYNGKQGDDSVSTFLKQIYTVRGEMSTANYTITNSNVPTYPIGWLPVIDFITANATNTYATNAASKISLDTIFEDSQSQWSTVNDELTNKAGQGRTFQILTSYDYSIDVRALNSGTPVAWEVEDNPTFGGVARCEVKLTLVAQSTTNNAKVAYIDAGSTVVSFNNGGTYTYASGWQSLGSGTNASFADLGVFDNNEKFDIHVLVYARYFNSVGNLVNNSTIYQNISSVDSSNSLVNLPCYFVDQSTGDDVRLEFDIDISNLTFKAVPDITELVKGSSVDIDRFIPKNIKQRDLIASISKSYNLVFVPDPDNDKNLIVKTRDKYYDDGAEWDWTGKFVEDVESTITFLSNDVAQDQQYTYKDDKDSINTAYQSEFGETYGKTTIVLDNEYSVGTDVRTLIYSPTPSIKSGIGVVLPSINGINPDNNIRVLLHNGKGTAFPYPFYDDVLPNPSELELVDSYCDASMFDSDITPNFSLCFDAPKVLFHGFQQGQTTNYLYNLHHQRELTTINQGKRLTAYFNLTEVDFQKLSKRLDWKIWIKDNGWFFISKVYGYNSGKRTITKVDIITADEKTRLKYKRPVRPIKPNGISFDEVMRKHFNGIATDSNIVIGDGQVSIDGRYNFVTGDRVFIQGNGNIVQASDVKVMGDSNTVPSGMNTSKLIGDNTTVEIPTTYINGKPVPCGGTVLAKFRIYQLGTAAPTIIEYCNPFGFTLTTIRDGAGLYRVQGFTGETMATDSSKYEIQFSTNSLLGGSTLDVYPSTDTDLVIRSYDNTGTLADNVILQYSGGTSAVWNVITVIKY